MYLSVRTFLERIRAEPVEDADVNWSEVGAAAHEKHEYLKALKAWKNASARGDADAQYRIGLMYARGEGVVRSIPDAVSWYRQAADAGHIDAQYQLGLVYLHGTVQGPLGADTWFQAASHHNNQAAQQALKALFPNGIAVEKDLVEAMRWMWAAATAGKVDAQAVLGEMYRHGLGCTQDYAEAARWFWLAAEQGVASAQFAMGDIYYQALGVASDHRAAAAWYERAAKNGDARAQVALASMCLAGEGRRADRNRAGRLFVQAAEQGEARGLYQAALMHLKGEGLPENIDRAETYLRRAAKQNYLPAIIKLAEFYAHGAGIEPDLREAAAWRTRAAELGDVQSQFIIGRLHATGTGVPINHRESARWFSRAAEQGHATAAHNMAVYYAQGTGVERDLERAIDWYKKAADEGITTSQVALGKLYAAGEGLPRDLGKATLWLQKAAESGDPEAKTALAMLHLQGEEGARDPSRAEELLKQAAEGGDAAAAMQLGHLYSGKYAVEAKSGDAVRWYTKAAEGGTIEAQHTLGMLYLNGRGVEKNLSAAATWIERAAQSGHAPSQFQLAVLYCTAQGVARDLAQAVAWYEQAAERGHPLAQYNLAVMLSKGQGCEADEARAASWFQKAASQGVAQAKRALADLSRAGHPPPPDNDATGSSLTHNQSAEPPPRSSTAQQGVDPATVRTSARSDQKNSNDGPSPHKDPNPASDSKPPRTAETLERSKPVPERTAHLPHPQEGSNPPTGTTDRDSGGNDNNPATGRFVNTMRVPDPSGSIASFGTSDPVVRQKGAPPASLLNSIRPEPSARGEQDHNAPSASAFWPDPNQGGQPAPQYQSDPEALQAGSKPAAYRDQHESVRPHRAVETSVSPESTASRGHTIADTAMRRPIDRSTLAEPTKHHLTPKPDERFPSQMNTSDETKPKADLDEGTRKSAATLSSRVTSAEARQRQPLTSTSVEPLDSAPLHDRVDRPAGAATEERDLEQSLKALSQLGRLFDALAGNEPHPSRKLPSDSVKMSVAPDDHAATAKPRVNREQGKPDLSARSANDDTSGSSERREAKDQEALVRVMADIGNRLRMSEHTDQVTSPALSADRLQEKTARDHEYEQGQLPSDQTNLDGPSEPPVAPPRSGGLSAARDDTAFKNLARAMAELGIHPRIDVRNNVPSIDAATPSSSTRSLGSQQSSLNFRRDADQVDTPKPLSTDAEKLKGEEAWAELERTVGQLGTTPGLRAMVPSPVPKAAENPTTEKIDPPTTYEQMRSGLGARPAGQSTSDLKAHSNSRRSPDPPKSDHVVDRFLSDLSRQLDDIELLLRRPLKQ